MANSKAKSTNPTIQIHHEEVPKPTRSSSDMFRSSSPADQHFHLALPSSRTRGGSPSISDRGLGGIGDGSGSAADEKALIKSLEVLAKIVGFQKSFSTNDILGIEDGYSNHSQKNTSNCHYGALRILQRSQSDMHLIQMCDRLEFTSRLDPNSRSLSTWVAVGDTSATTQLPSPQARLSTASPNFTPADLVRSVNKRIRQSYLKKRVLTSYKALERLSQSGFDLEKLQRVVAETGKISPELARLVSPIQNTVANKEHTGSPGKQTSKGKGQEHKSTVTKGSMTAGKDVSLSSREIDRDRGKPLSKYERNVMIFDWLHTLDEKATLSDLN